MAANATTTKSQPKKSATTTQTQRSEATKVREGVTKVRNGATTYVRRTGERAVDVPVGAALTVADRVNETVEPWTKQETRESELKAVRQRVERELNKIERRGGTARRKATQRAKQNRNRFERELKARRVKAETTLKENRQRAEESLTRAQTAVQERVSTLV